MKEVFETNSSQSLSTGCAVILSLILASLLILGAFDMSLVSAAPLRVDTPTFSPAGGTYSSPQSVTIRCDTANATIRYTVDETTPSSSSTIYLDPIFISNTTTIKAKAFLSGWSDSSTASAKYTINLPKVAKPTFSPGAGTYSSPQNVTIQCATIGATVRYTTDGSDPSSASTAYSGPIFVSATTTVKAKAFKSNMRDSDTASATYTINLPKVATPTFNPAGGTYSSAQTVALSCATPGATITYTTDGSEPSSSSPAYSSPILISANTTVKAKAFMSWMTDSNTASATYTINIPPKVATPTFSPSGGTYSSPQNVTLSCSTSGASIRYTTDGSEPSSSSTVYSTSISISSTTTFKAEAFKSGMTDSDTAQATYTITAEPEPNKVSTPTFSPAGGTYSSPQDVALSCATSNATIRYTVDGSEPSSSSAVYSGPISVIASATVKARAFLAGMTDSDTASATYTISTSGKVAAPTISPAGGSYSAAQSVVIQCGTSGAVIRYTMSGLYPESSSPVYSGPISVGVSTVIMAQAFVSGMKESDVAYALYTINADTSSQELLFGLEIAYAAIAIIAVVAVLGGALFYLRRRKEIRFQKILLSRAKPRTPSAKQ